MTVHEFGQENKKTVVLIHPSLVMWDYFEYVRPLLEKKYHLVIPALPGYDPDEKCDYTSVEQIARDIEDWLIVNNGGEADCIYGCSMGGSIVARILADNRIAIKSAVIDGGITPYQLPRPITFFIALRDFLMILLGRIGGTKLLEKAFSADEYTEEDIAYVTKVLRMISLRTIWRTFDSCNNYSMPKKIATSCRTIEYWLAESEIKARKWDIRYIRKAFPGTVFRKVKGIGHAGLATLRPEAFAKGIDRILK